MPAGAWLRIAPQPQGTGPYAEPAHLRVDRRDRDLAASGAVPGADLVPQAPGHPRGPGHRQGRLRGRRTVLERDSSMASSGASTGTVAGRPQPQTTAEAAGGPFVRHAPDGRRAMYVFTQTSVQNAGFMANPMVSSPGW